MSSPRISDLTLYRRLLPLSRPYLLHIVGLFVLSLLAAPLALLAPVPLKIAVDSVVGAEPPPAFVSALLPAAAAQSAFGLLLAAAALLVLIALLSQLQSQGSTLLRTYTGDRLVLRFRAALFQHVQRLSLSYHDSKGSSDSLYRIQYDASAIQYIAIDGIIPFVSAGVTVVSMLVVTFLIDWQLGIIALVLAPVFLMLTGTYRMRLRRQSREVKKLESASLGVVQEVLGAVRVVKAFGQEDREQQRFERRSIEGVDARFRLTASEGWFGLLVGLTGSLGMAAVLLVGVRHVQADVLTLGDLLLVMGYIAQVYGPLKTVSHKIARLQSHLASAERAFALLDEAPDVPERPDARPIERAAGGIAFDDVTFAYGRGEPVLRSLSFEIPPGSRVGIAGPTGAGKTTMASLLTRFYDPVSGRILLDGVDLRDYRIADLREQFAIVLQDPVLFSTSVAENIAYGRPGAGTADIQEAARAANAHDFIAALPEGYQTLVGERGMRLSGGERQRIALARAFLKDAPILILDEPTSSVDVATEAVIMEAMERLMAGRTAFMIAHRLGTLGNCDMLLVIEDGRLTTVTTAVSETLGRADRAGGLEAALRSVQSNG